LRASAIDSQFCDMVGSSALSTQLDPEEQREVEGGFQTGCAREIKRLGRRPRNIFGDGVLAYFGYPTREPVSHIP